MVTKKVTKKKAASPKKKSSSRKKVAKKAVAKKEQTPSVEEAKFQLKDDGRVVPIGPLTKQVEQLLAGTKAEATEEKAVPSTPSPSVDERTRVREQRRLEKQQRMEELRRRREAANAAAALGNVASIADARKKQAPPPAAPVSPVSKAPVAPTPLPQSEDRATNHMTVAIPELLKYKLMAKEGAYKAAVEPIKQAVREAAQRRLNEELAKTLSENERCVQAAKEFEDCVNEILLAVQPHLPQGYAVVHIAAEDSVAVCKHAPDQAGKMFRLKLG